MSRTKIIAGCIALFLAGMVAGGSLVGLYTAHKVKRFANATPTERARMLADRLSDKLGLDGERATAVRAIVAEGHRRIYEAGPDADRRTIREETFRRIEQLLTSDEERERLDKVRAFFAKRHTRHEPEHEPGEKEAAE